MMQLQMLQNTHLKTLCISKIFSVKVLIRRFLSILHCLKASQEINKERFPTESTLKHRAGVQLLEPKLSNPFIFMQLARKMATYIFTEVNLRCFYVALMVHEGQQHKISQKELSHQMITSPSKCTSTKASVVKFDLSITGRLRAERIRTERRAGRLLDPQGTYMIVLPA